LIQRLGNLAASFLALANKRARAEDILAGRGGGVLLMSTLFGLLCF
jgi:hypothetical protein